MNNNTDWIGLDIRLFNLHSIGPGPVCIVQPKVEWSRMVLSKKFYIKMPEGLIN